LAAAALGITGSAYISLGEAANPLFAWPGDQGQSAIDGSTPPPVVLPGRVRTPAEPTHTSAPAQQIVRVERGDTLASVLARADVPARQTHAAVEALRAVYNPRHLQVGQEIALTLAASESGMDLVGLELAERFDRYAGITLYPDGGYKSFLAPKRLTRLNARTAGTIKSSLFSDGIEAGVPARTMANFMRLFSFDIDFERDIHPEDKFELVYDRYIDRDGNLVHNGDLLYAGLEVGGKVRGYYRFGDGDGEDAYYDADGRSIRKALLRTPVDGARKSSGFGMRRHPISGYTKMHKGIDFAAPRGTPIRAAGDGVISFAGTKGGYGRYISIRHNSDYTTAYAHMHRLAKGMRKGQRVKQGQVIGYVGSTGRSTGPHLHYEVLLKGKHVNPTQLRLPSGKSLTGPELARFKQQVAAVDALRKGRASDTLLAARPE
jgi:murein DD-endopeptidase MepM/ murein hydrolase activator NlpD